MASLVGLESGDGAIVLNLHPKMGLLDLANAASEDEGSYTPEILKQFGADHRSGLMYWTWSGSGTPGGGGMPDDFLQRTFDLFRNVADVTIVDFPLLTADEAAPVLPLLDIIIVVSSSSDLLALRSTRTFLDLMPPEVKPRVRIVLNRADPSDMISREDFEQTMELKVAAVLPNEPQVTAHAINIGTPFVLTQPQSGSHHQSARTGPNLVQTARERRKRTAQTPLYAFWMKSEDKNRAASTCSAVFGREWGRKTKKCCITRERALF